MKNSKWILFGLALMLLIFPNGVSAHTGLKTSSPENEQTVKEEVKAISMEFNTDIEPVSKFEIEDDEGNLYKVADIVVDNSRMSGTLEQPLKNGSYIVNWKIIGQDGHAIKGSFTFRVDAPPVQSESPTAEETAAAPSPSPSEPDSSPAVTDQPDKDPSDESPLEASSRASWIVIVLVGLVLIIMIGSIIRKKRS